MKSIQIYDTTLRDGEQAPGAAMRKEQKLEIAHALQDLGVDTIEAGFPFASQDDADAVREIAKTCREVRIAAFARTKSEDIVAAADVLRDAAQPRISLVMPVSELHIRTKLGLDADASLAHLTANVRHARSLCADVEVIAEDALRADPTFLARATGEALRAGAGMVTIADTVGYATPVDIESLIAELFAQVSELNAFNLGIHCHDDLGLGTVNTLTALRAGASQAHCTVNGLGERAGNAALEEIVMAMCVRADRFPMQCKVETTKLWQTSRLVSALSSFPIPPNKAIVGGNAYAHGSGMHQDGILKAADTYEIIAPEWVGAPSRQLPITRHSGRKGLTARLSALGIALDDADVSRLLIFVKGELSDISVLSDTELKALVARLR